MNKLVENGMLFSYATAVNHDNNHDGVAKWLWEHFDKKWKVIEGGLFMTAQIGDKFTFRGSDYSIVAISTPIKFKPIQFGITPLSVGTACWAGYWCEYDISEEGIVLKNLYINSKDNNYPPINGVEAEGEDKDFKYMGHHLYKNVGIPIKYTGKILVGKDFLREYYIHMGYQRAWAYQTLVEFIFEDGSLLDTVDHSQMAEKLREEIKKDTGKPKPYIEQDIPRFVKNSFSLDIDVKAWWMKPLDVPAFLKTTLD